MRNRWNIAANVWSANVLIGFQAPRAPPAGAQRRLAERHVGGELLF